MAPVSDPMELVLVGAWNVDGLAAAGAPKRSIGSIGDRNGLLGCWEHKFGEQLVTLQVLRAPVTRFGSSFLTAHGHA